MADGYRCGPKKSPPLAAVDIFVHTHGYHLVVPSWLLIFSNRNLTGRLSFAATWSFLFAASWSTQFTVSTRPAETRSVPRSISASPARPTERRCGSGSHRRCSLGYRPATVTSVPPRETAIPQSISRPFQLEVLPGKYRRHAPGRQPGTRVAS